ncbi:response regulator [Paragemmobacter straminiformis]|uniref:histidine kinase n=1 Tax=Paragemmobacter straminiformis TaxID=2045119 RepID=A0A842IDI5_9RHOB|nr:response regulator [Gemmobacter straminiformis]MBC2837579.1 response regulator [Gemmobacter straminiformis]
MAGHAMGLRGRFGRWMTGAPVVERVAGNAVLPVVPAMRKAHVSHQPPADSLAPFSGREALVADDNEINRLILKTFLERLGFGVTLASDGLEAVENWQPGHDLVCLDIEMPGQDGIAALAGIQTAAKAKGADMPLALAVTVNSLSHQVAQYLSAGFDSCLPKPFSRAELEVTLRQRWPQ